MDSTTALSRNRTNGLAGELASIDLWAAGEGLGTPFPAVTRGVTVPSTVHSPYYYCSRSIDSLKRGRW